MILTKKVSSFKGYVAIGIAVILFFAVFSICQVRADQVYAEFISATEI